MGENLCDAEWGKEFLNIIAKPWFIKEKMISWILSKLKFCSTKDFVKRVERLAMSLEKILASYMSDKGLIYRIYSHISMVKKN